MGGPEWFQSAFPLNTYWLVFVRQLSFAHKLTLREYANRKLCYTSLPQRHPQSSAERSRINSSSNYKRCPLCTVDNPAMLGKA